MSLDVYLYEIDNPTPPELCFWCVTATDAERNSEDWNHYHEHLVFDQNITHNLGPMASAVDDGNLYTALWEPEMFMDTAIAAQVTALEADKKYREARDLQHTMPRATARIIEPYLYKGLNLLRAQPDYYKTFEPAPDPHTGKPWGQYVNFLPWIEKYLVACRDWPDAIVRVSR